MRRVIRKYDDFVKSKSVNEDIETMVTPELAENEEGFESTEDVEDSDSANLVDSEEDVAPEGYEGGEEEESGEYEGTKRLNKLAEILGASVSNNEIDYEGQKIRFYSEDEKFHIGKDKFETPEEVVEFLQGSEEVVESKRFTRKKRK
jgi:hypothetical protein